MPHKKERKSKSPETNSVSASKSPETNSASASESASESPLASSSESPLASSSLLALAPTSASALASPSASFQNYEPTENDLNSLESNCTDSRSLEGASAKSSDTVVVTDSPGVLGSQNSDRNVICNISSSSSKKITQINGLKDNYFALYGKQPRGAYQNQVWWLKSKIEEMESSAVKRKLEEGKEESSEIMSSVEIGADSGFGQIIDVPRHKMEMQSERLSEKFDDASESYFDTPKIYEGTDEDNKEVERLRKKYEEIFDIAPRGPYQNKLWWLKSKIKTRDPKQTQELKSLKKKYYDMFGTRPRGAYANAIWWLTLKMKEHESDARQKDKETTELNLTTDKVKSSASLEDTLPPYDRPRPLKRKRPKTTTNSCDRDELISSSEVTAQDVSECITAAQVAMKKSSTDDRPRPLKRKRSKTTTNSCGRDELISSSEVTAQDVSECIIAAQVAMKKSSTDPGVMENLAKAAELIAKKQYPQLMVTTGRDDVIKKFSFKGAVTVKCGTCQQNNIVKFKFDS